MNIELLELFDNIEEFDKDCKDLSNRCYNWGLVSYADISELKPLIDKAKHYAYIYHDKDKCKSPHYHLLLHFDPQWSFNKLTEFIDNYVASSQNTYKKPIKNKKGAFEYLTHLNNPDKYQYDEELIITDNKSFWTLEKAEKNIIDLLDDINNGLSYRDLIKKWGRDFIINENKYRAAAEHLYFAENN